MSVPVLLAKLTLSTIQIETRLKNGSDNKSATWGSLYSLEYSPV